MKKVKWFSCIAAAMAIAVASASLMSASSAADASTDPSDTVLPTDYISSDDAALLAEDVVAQFTGSEPVCPWNADTDISATVPMYDFDGNANSYLFRLETDGTPTGYVYVDANHLAPDVIMFSYGEDQSGPSDISMFDAELGKTITASDDVIAAEPEALTAVQTDVSAGDNSTYTDIQTKQQINATKQQLKKMYIAEKKAAKNQEKIDKLNTVKQNKGQEKKAAKATAYTIPKAESLAVNDLNYSPLAAPKVKPVSMTVNGSVYVNGVVTSGGAINMYPYICNFFTPANTGYSTDNNCVPTAMTNLFYYWSLYSPSHYSALMSNAADTFKALYAYAQTTTGGTSSSNVYNAMVQYAKSRGLTPAGGAETGGFDGIGIAQAWVKTNIDNGNPIVTMIGDKAPQYANHAVLITGYVPATSELAVLSYLRVCDGRTDDPTMSFAYNENTMQYVMYGAYVRF